MTRGFHHPAETFFKNHLHAARSCSRPPKICRLQPSAGYVGLCRGTQKSFIRSSTRRGADPARKPVKTTFNTLSLNILYLHISNFPYFCGMKKDFNTGLRKGIEADRVKLTRRRKLLLRDMGLAEDLERGLKRLEKRFRTGLLSDTGRTIVLDKPVCIVFV